MNPILFRALKIGSPVQSIEGGRGEGILLTGPEMVVYGNQGTFGPFRDVQWADGYSTSIEAKDLAGGKGICP